MSIPLDRLYNYIESIAEEIYGNTIVIYRFYPYGSKKLKDLIHLKFFTWQERSIFLNIYCNDQEPLNYEYYENHQLYHGAPASRSAWNRILEALSIAPRQNLKNDNIYDKVLILHSEQRSKNLEMYRHDNFIPVYYWNHAILALDWFRYANHVVIKKTLLTKKFLIYNRAWSGTREYRLKFADLLINNELVDDCQTSVGFFDQDVYYKNHKFINLAWQPLHQLENYFICNSAPSTHSADFTIEDYANTDVEVVLETLFDDDRLQLTEKSLRPIACGQPFILAATHGSLQYLQNYGFKTFNDVFDESYDQIEDPVKRLKAIVALMVQISKWTDDERSYKIMQLQQIAEYNRTHFFSKEFFNQVITELKENLTTAFTLFNSTKSCSQWIQKWENLMQHQLAIDFLKSNQSTNWPTTQDFELVYKEAKNISNDHRLMQR